MRTKPVLEHALLEPFEPRLKGFLELGFDGGVRSLQAGGYKLGDDLVNDDARERFRDGLFSSFAQTQSVVGQLFVDLERKRREMLANRRGLRMAGQRVSPEIQAQLEVIETRQLVLRRLMDGILWVLLPQPWMARPLAFQRDIRRPDPDELMKILAIAWEQNRDSRKEIHLVADLTNIVQIGDIIRIRWDEDGVYVRLQEIKSGPVNDALADFIDSRADPLTVADFEAIERRFGRHAKAQAIRMMRQRERFRQFGIALEDGSLPSSETSKNESNGVPKTGRPPAVTTYLSRLPDLVGDAKRRGIGLHCIDGCLWLSAVSERPIPGLNDLKQLPHYLFHLKHPELRCQIEENESLRKEPPLVNLAAHNMTYVMSRSPLIWYPKDLVLDVVMGRVTIYVQFDLEAFFRLGLKAGLELALITGKEAEQGKQAKASGPMVENRKAYGVKVKLSGGNVLKLRSSLFRSVYSHLVPPSEVLRIIAAAVAAGQPTPP